MDKRKPKGNELGNIATTSLKVESVSQQVPGKLPEPGRRLPPEGATRSTLDFAGQNLDFPEFFRCREERFIKTRISESHDEMLLKSVRDPYI